MAIPPFRSGFLSVPLRELTPYRISDETDFDYKQVVMKEYTFITANLYSQPEAFANANV